MKTKITNHTGNDQYLLDYAKQLDFGELYFKLDKKTGLLAIIAIHSTKLGPALGGCRCLEYDSLESAIEDAMRLASGMTYKSAITGLPLGGGKSVLIKPKHLKNRNAYFEVFGNFIEGLNGRYISAVDSGTNTTDMDAIAQQTRFVTSTSGEYGGPSPYTAYGVFLAIKAAVKFKLDKDDLNGITVAIQGVGNVGYVLANYLHEANAKLIITDTSQKALEKCAKDFNPEIIALDAIYDAECDIFSPCALGATINDETIPRLQASMVIGSANNQLAESRHADQLHEKGILYAPDYVINAGGLVHACAQFYKTPMADVEEHVNRIYDTTMTILRRSAKENISTHIIADTIAEERLNQDGNSTIHKELDEIL